MKYRAEIDGLRAIAVIPVILFHAGFEQFSGGFVGVDVFFVISGYLIATIILSEMEQGTFSLVNFYERRARRILPALFLVMFVSLPFAWFWLLPSDMKDFSESLVAVSTFSSNILFWQETGYWGVDNELKPMLHTWSLAVEEQYYVIFPLFLMLMWRFGKRWILSSFLLITVISLLLSQWAAYNLPTANFFLLPTRGWELAVGAIIAFYFLYRKESIRVIQSNKIVDDILSFGGLLLILYAVFWFDETVPFPSFFALIPTLGAALIIVFSSSQTLVGRLLASKLMVGVGLISYSAYLWHQPIFAFARHRSLTEPSVQLFSLLALLTFVLAYLTWRYVEKPFRTKGIFHRKAIFILGVTGSVFFITVGLAGHLTDGFNGLMFKNKLTENVIEEKLKLNYGLSNKCNGGESVFSPECSTNIQPEILVWGDSFAMHLIPGIIASSPNSKIIQMTKSKCGPFFGIAPITKKYTVTWAEGCLKFNEKVRNWIKANTSVKYIVVSSPFSQYVSKNNKFLFRNGEVEAASMDIAIHEFNKTLSELETMGVKPIVFSPPPTTGGDIGRCLAKAQWMGLKLNACDFSISDLSQERRDAYHFLEMVEKTHQVVRLDKMICKNSVCLTHIDSYWIYRDSGHLSIEGSATLGQMYDFHAIIIK